MDNESFERCAQIIPFPSPSARDRHTQAPPLELDPAYRAWCDPQNRRAVDLDQPLPLRSELRTRYKREKQVTSAEGMNHSDTNHLIRPVSAQQAHAKRIETGPGFWVFCDRERRTANDRGQPSPMHAELRARYVREKQIEAVLAGDK